jgi:hypothetical protein
MGKILLHIILDVVETGREAHIPIIWVDLLLQSLYTESFFLDSSHKELMLPQISILSFVGLCTQIIRI